MRTTVTARHCAIPDRLRLRAHEQIVKVAKVAHRAQDADIVFDADHGRKVVEIKLHLPRSHWKVATAEADDFRTALDSAVDKLRNQLDKSGRRTMRRAPVY